MKKAKVLIPAIAVLALSAASAVTGTVAWFTATRTANVTAEGITIVNTEASLIATPKADAAGGTSAPGQSKQIKHAPLRDGSVDMHGTPTPDIWSAVIPDDNSAPETFKKLTDSFSDTVGGDGNPVYRATHFLIEFKFAKAIGGDTFGLFFDAKNSTTSIDTGKEIKTAFRVGMKCGEEIVVWAPYAVGSSVSYINKTSVPDGTYTTAADLVVGQAATVAKYEKGAAGVPFLADMTKTNVEGHEIKVDVYTWWEGSDANVANGNETGFVAANYDLHFNLVKQTEPAPMQ